MTSATDLALQAFESRPTRAEPLYDLARHFREKGMNHVALIFAERALRISQPDDSLFVETGVYQWGAREEYSIVAYSDADRRRRGRAICDGLALDRNVPQATRDMARQNLFWYCLGLAEQAPSFAPQRLQFDPPEGWRAMNPSVAIYGDLIAINIRTVNYRIDDGGRYVMPEGETAIRTRNFLGALDPDDIGRLRAYNEVHADLGKPLYDQVIGLEDIRLFDLLGDLYCSATVRQMNREGWCEIILGQLLGGREFSGYRIISQKGRHEKNWMPVIGSEGLFIYSCQDKGDVFACDNFSGGSQAIPFRGGHLALIHEAIQSPIDGKRCYQHRFVWFDGKMQLVAASHRFFLEATNQVEFAAGMCPHPDGRRLIISYGIRDAEAWVATIDADEVDRMLGPKSPDKSPSASCGELRGDLQKVSGLSWVYGQLNHPLLHDRDINQAIDRLREMDLPRHPDRPKNWDNLLAVSLAAQFCGKNDLIMDAGGTRDSAFLPGLHKLGFKRLINLNLEDRGFDVDADGILYRGGDITETGRADKALGFVACLSVLEHGVNWRNFLNEMARVIKPGGHLFISFDYWESKIDAGDRFAFGAPVKIFDFNETYLLIGYAKDVGLEVVGDVDLKCADRVVDWVGLQFTFMNLLFQRSLV